MLEYMLPVVRGRIASLVKSEKGATAVEYGIMVAAIAAVIIGIVITLGNQVVTVFTNVSESLAGIVGG